MLPNYCGKGQKAQKSVLLLGLVGTALVCWIFKAPRIRGARAGGTTRTFVGTILFPF
jgi:hypothetical protein